MNPVLKAAIGVVLGAAAGFAYHLVLKGAGAT